MSKSSFQVLKYLLWGSISHTTLQSFKPLKLVRFVRAHTVWTQGAIKTGLANCIQLVQEYISHAPRIERTLSMYIELWEDKSTGMSTHQTHYLHVLWPLERLCKDGRHSGNAFRDQEIKGCVNMVLCFQNVYPHHTTYPKVKTHVLNILIASHSLSWGQNAFPECLPSLHNLSNGENVCTERLIASHRLYAFPAHLPYPHSLSRCQNVFPKHLPALHTFPVVKMHAPNI